MPVSYAIPPWVGRPADPAAHYAQGFQIGVHLGAQQAAQMFQQQQMQMQHQKELMAEQQQEVENQYNTQVLNLKAAELARKHQANQIFQARIAQGEDPSQVLMQLAPELGESATSVLHNQAVREQARAMMGYRQQALQQRDDIASARLEATDKAKQEALAEKKTEFKEREDRLKASAANRVKQAAENAVMRDPNLKTLRSTADDFNSMLAALKVEKPTLLHPLRTSSVIAAERTAAEKSLKETLDDIAKREREIRNHFQTMAGQVDPEDQSFNPESWQPPEPQTATPVVAGNNTMPDQPAAPSRRLRFDGKVFQEVK